MKIQNAIITGLFLIFIVFLIYVSNSLGLPDRDLFCESFNTSGNMSFLDCENLFCEYFPDACIIEDNDSNVSVEVYNRLENLENLVSNLSLLYNEIFNQTLVLNDSYDEINSSFDFLIHALEDFNFSLDHELNITSQEVNSSLDSVLGSVVTVDEVVSVVQDHVSRKVDAEVSRLQRSPPEIRKDSSFSFLHFVILLCVILVVGFYFMRVFVEYIHLRKVKSFEDYAKHHPNSNFNRFRFGIEKLGRDAYFINKSREKQLKEAIRQTCEKGGDQLSYVDSKQKEENVQFSEVPFNQNKFESSFSNDEDLEFGKFEEE